MRAARRVVFIGCIVARFWLVEDPRVVVLHEVEEAEGHVGVTASVHEEFGFGDVGDGGGGWGP